MRSPSLENTVMSDFVSGACRVRPGETRERSLIEPIERAHLHAEVRGYRSHATEDEKAVTRRITAEKDLSDTPTYTGIGGQKEFKF